MPLSTKLGKPLTAHVSSYDSEEDAQKSETASAHSSESGDGDAVSSVSNRKGLDEDVKEDEYRSHSQTGDSTVSDYESELEGDAQQQLSSISFGALAQASDAIRKSTGRKRKRSEDTSGDHEEKLQALKDRLREIKDSKSRRPSSTPLGNASTLSHTTKIREQYLDPPESDTESPSSEDEKIQKEPSRLSKHAPAIQSSKRPVSRNRTVIAVSDPKAKALDPRFSSLSGPAPDASKLRQRYAFLDDYRRSEMDEIRTTLDSGTTASGKKQKKHTSQMDEETKDRLKKELGRMENRARAESDKERQGRVMREWKRAEREKVQQGKRPFYLKSSEKKKLALVDRFESMKGKEREKAMRKKTKRQGEKEKRNMPAARRVRR